MEGAVLLNFDSNVNGVITNCQLCPTWEVVCTEYALPIASSTQLEEVQLNNQTLDGSVVENKDPKYIKKLKHNKVKKGPGDGKELGPDCGCPIKCFQKIGEDRIQKIFQDFWALADYNSQNAYLFGLINIIGVKRRYTKNETSRRNFTIVYHIKDKGQNVPVCKKAFLNIHGLQKNRGRINNLANKMKEGTSVPPPDKRGRHKNRPNAYREEDIEHVRRHLIGCPKADRRKTMAFSTKRCYALYVSDYCKKNDVQPVSLDKFRRVFAMEGYKNGNRGMQKSKK